MLLAAGCAHDPAPSRGEALATTTPATDAVPVVPGALEATLELPAPYAEVAVRTAGEHFRASSARRDGLTISLHATDLSHPVLTDDELGRLPPATHEVRGVPARVLSNEGIRSVAWAEGGLDYALEVECARPLDDARCTEDAFVLELAASLVRAGGR